MKAYRIDNPNGFHEIIQAETLGKAKDIVANLHAIDFDEAEVKRTPEFDGHDPVPAEVFLANGWWLECDHCYHRVDDEGCCECQEEGEAQYVTDGTTAYCSAECRDNERETRARWKHQKEEAMRMSRQRVEKAFPGIEIIGVSAQFRAVGNRQWSGIVTFKYPGARWTSTWNEYDPGQIWVPNGDLDAWKTWWGTKQPPPEPSPPSR